VLVNGLTALAPSVAIVTRGWEPAGLSHPVPSPGPGREQLAAVLQEKEHRGKGNEWLGKKPSGRNLLYACCFLMTHFRTTAIEKSGFCSSSPIHSTGQRHLWKSARAHHLDWATPPGQEAPSTSPSPKTRRARQGHPTASQGHRVPTRPRGGGAGDKSPELPETPRCLGLRSPGQRRPASPSPGTLHDRLQQCRTLKLWPKRFFTSLQVCSHFYSLVKATPLRLLQSPLQKRSQA